MSFLREGPISLIARLVRSEALTNEDLALPRANRVSFEFDAIDAKLDDEAAISTIADKADRSRLAVLKVLTTAEHFRHLAGVPDYWDGQWYWIDLLPREKKSGPLAWASSLGEGGYLENIPLVLDGIRHLFSEDEPPLTPVGAYVAEGRARAHKIAAACEFPDSAKEKQEAATELLRAMANPYQVLVRDVGQASFCTAIDQNDNELFHLDAGWPIPYNGKTASTKPSLKSHGAPVILSHWDWDHLHGYHAIAGLSNGHWIAPEQRLGPGAALVANSLARRRRLLGLRSTGVAVGALTIRGCCGAAGNLNQSGLCVETTLRSGKMVLFTGDADYDHAYPGVMATPDFLVATHHGANFAGHVVSPKARPGRCVVSVGKGNRYRHPSPASITKHSNAGWLLAYTCDEGSVPRGNRLLGP